MKPGAGLSNSSNTTAASEPAGSDTPKNSLSSIKTERVFFAWIASPPPALTPVYNAPVANAAVSRIEVAGAFVVLGIVLKLNTARMNVLEVSTGSVATLS